MVERIDKQHMELFRVTKDLIHAVDENAGAEEYKNIIKFLKDYVVYHFKDEEEYQASVGYEGIEEHKAEHREFTKKIAVYEKELEKTGFNIHTMKELAGHLTAWLIYHVADADQKIVSGDKGGNAEKHFDMCVELFSDSAMDVMEKMAGFSREKIIHKTVVNHRIKGDIFIGIEIIGDLKGRAVFAFSKELSLNLIRILTSMELEEADEMVRSALCEITNISCGKASIELAEKGVNCDIKTPVILDNSLSETEINGMFIDTGSGGLEVMVFVDEMA